MVSLKTKLILGTVSLALGACGNTAEIAPQPMSSEPTTSAKSEPQMTGSKSAEPSTGNDANYARDGNIAIQEEFQAAEIKGTIAAYDMFIARHPDHELSKLAKIRIAEIKRK